MKLPPALAAKLTDQVLERLPPPPARVLEVGFAGIHATPLRLAGYEVEVLDDDPRAIERAGAVVDAPTGCYDAVVAPSDADLAGIDARVLLRIGPDDLPPAD